MGSRSNRTSYLSSGSRCLLALLLAAGTSYAQEVTASASGVVTDPSGSPVPEAKVSAKDLDRGSTFSAVTNPSGFYSMPRLPIGKYEFRAEIAGFKSAVQTGIQLELNTAAKVDFPLQVGDVQQVVDVADAAPLLQTESTQLGTIIDARTNTQLPLATRNYVQLTLLTAGAVTPDPSGFKGGQATFYSARPNINGNRQQTNNFLLDGLDNNQVSDNEVAYAPSPDAIAEFNEITSNPSPEFGNFMGGITSVSIKSGTNKYHGTAFEFFRNDKLNANEWANNFSGGQRQKLRWNEFGGTMGGPIKKDKLFFFADYQGSRFDHPTSTGATSLLTAAERKGDFSAFLQQPTPIQLFNPFSTTTSIMNGKTVYTRAPFPNNQIPTSLFSTVATNIINSPLYPTPTSSALKNNFITAERDYDNSDQGDGRMDWNASDKDRVFVRYSQVGIDNPSFNSLATSYNAANTFKIYNGAVDYTRTLTPTLVNDARIGINYNYNFTAQSPSGIGNLNTKFGLPGVPGDILPALCPAGGYIGCIGNSNNIQLFADTVIQYEDTAIFTKGTHTLKFGFQGYRIRLDTFYSGNNGAAGSINFNGQYTNAGLGSTATLVPEADFLLGLPSSVGVGTNGGTWGQRGNTFAAFAQDTWRVTPNLTVNFGLRYELHTPWVEVKNRQANFTLFGGQEAIAGTNSPLFGDSRGLYNQYNGIFNYQPRIGLAWIPGGGRTVIRAAYSISSYLEGTGTNLRLTLNPPFSTEKTATYTLADYPVLPGSTLDQGFTTITSASNPAAGSNLHIWDPNVRPAVAQNWNMAIQHEFTNSTTLQTAYVGQKNDHLVVAQPYFQNILGPNGTVLPGPYLSGNPALKSIIGQISGTETNGNQEYESLQVTLLQRLAKGVSGQFAYTYSKCMTDSTGFYGAGGAQASGQSPYMQNIYDRRAEWGECGYDATHVVSSYFSWDIPIGRNRMLGQNMNKLADAVVGGWQVNGILSFHGGFPITMFVWDDPSGTGARGARATCPKGIQKYGNRNAPGNLGGGYEWVEPTDFVEPSAGTFGTCGVSIYRGPGLATADLSASKKFNFSENQNLEFRAEFINALNHPILTAPNPVVGTTAGFVQGSTGARQIQFGLKYNF